MQKKMVAGFDNYENCESAATWRNLNDVLIFQVSPDMKLLALEFYHSLNELLAPVTYIFFAQKIDNNSKL